MIVAFLVLCVVVISSLWILSPGKQSASTIGTGAAIAPTLEESQEQIPSQQESISEELLPPEVPLEEQQTETPKEKEFYEYGGSCASDVKDVQDDVSDVTTYLNQYQQEQTTYQSEYSSLQAEYEAKLAELKQLYESRLQEYDTKIQSTNKQVTEAQSDFEIAQKNLQETTTRCEPTP